MAILAQVLVAVLALPFLAILHGWVLTVMWAWFIVPTFALPQLSIPVAMGISLVMGYLTHQTNLETVDNSFGAAMASSIARPLLVLQVGWVVYQFV